MIILVLIGGEFCPDRKISDEYKDEPEPIKMCDECTLEPADEALYNYEVQPSGRSIRFDYCPKCYNEKFNKDEKPEGIS